MVVTIPPLKRVPPGATQEVRRRMLDEYKAELVRLNPRAFDAAGNVLPWWRVLLRTFAR